MSNKNLFSAFEVLSTSCRLSLGYIARYAPAFRTANCSTNHSKSQEMNL